MFGGTLHGIVVILGPLLLAAAIIWAIRNNRTSKRTRDRTEQATRDLYDNGTTGNDGSPG